MQVDTSGPYSPLAESLVRVRTWKLRTRNTIGMELGPPCSPPNSNIFLNQHVRWRSGRGSNPGHAYPGVLLGTQLADLIETRTDAYAVASGDCAQKCAQRMSYSKAQRERLAVRVRSFRTIPSEPTSKPPFRLATLSTSLDHSFNHPRYQNFGNGNSGGKLHLKAPRLERLHHVHVLGLELEELRQRLGHGPEAVPLVEPNGVERGRRGDNH